MSAVGTLLTLGLAWVLIIGVFYVIYRFDVWYTRREYRKDEPRRR